MKPIFREAAATAGLAGAEAQMARLRRALLEAEDGHGGRLADDASFKRRAAALEIQLLGLQALAARCAAEQMSGRSLSPKSAMLGAERHHASAPQSSSRGPSPKSALLELRCTQLRQAIAETMIEAAGYYALAAPNRLLLHNEGPIGPDWAASAAQEMLAEAKELGPADADAHRRLIVTLFGTASF